MFDFMKLNNEMKERRKRYNGIGTLVNYIRNDKLVHKSFISYACYALLDVNGFGDNRPPTDTSHIVTLFAGNERHQIDDACYRYVAWLLDPVESPWKDILPYLEITDPKEVTEGGFIIKTDVPNKFMYNFLIASRFMYEPHYVSFIWDDLVQNYGYTGTEAFLFTSYFYIKYAHNITVQSYNYKGLGTEGYRLTNRMVGGHDALSGRYNLNSIAWPFAQGRWNKKLCKPYETNHSCTPASVIWYDKDTEPMRLPELIGKPVVEAVALFKDFIRKGPTVTEPIAEPKLVVRRKIKKVEM